MVPAVCCNVRSGVLVRSDAPTNILPFFALFAFFPFLSIFRCCSIISFVLSVCGRLWKPTPSKTDEFSEKFQRVWGGGSFSIQKFMLQIFAIIDDTSVMNFRKNLQHNFPKMRGGRGVKGRLELFRKFIRFGRGMRP